MRSSVALGGAAAGPLAPPSSLGHPAPATAPRAAVVGAPCPSPAGSTSEVIRVREALRSLIDLSMLSRREIERRLAAFGGAIDLNRLLAGRSGIQLRHLLDILQVIGIEPQEFFHLTFKEPPQRSVLLQRLGAVFPQRALAVPRPTTPAPAADDLEELRQRVGSLQREIEQLSAVGAAACADCRSHAWDRRRPQQVRGGRGPPAEGTRGGWATAPKQGGRSASGRPPSQICPALVLSITLDSRREVACVRERPVGCCQGTGGAAATGRVRGPPTAATKRQV